MNRLTKNGRLFLILGVAVGLMGLSRDRDSWASDHGWLRADDQANRVTRLIEQLGADEFYAREQSQAELARLGLEAFDALYRARHHEDIEIAMRARYLVRSIPIRWTQAHDPTEVRRILRQYDQYRAAERVSRMQRLAMLPQWEGTEALGRLVRFETSGLLSKRAALLVLRQPAPEQVSRRQTLAQTIHHSVGTSRRRAGDWLRAYATFLVEPENTIGRWGELIRMEQDVFRQSPDITSYEIVRDLMRWYVQMLGQLGHDAEAVAAMKQTLQLRNGAPEDILDLVDWLMDREAWTVIDEVAQKYADKFGREATLIYRLAEAQARKGEKEKAEQTAKRALATQADDRIVVASQLRERGLFPWAHREYQHVLEIEKAESRLSIEARISLSEMLHDQQRDLEAARTLQPAVDLIQSNRAVQQMMKQWRNNGPGGIISRMHCFYALHFGGLGNREKQMQHLRLGIKSNPTDADVLIAMYRLPEPDDPWRKDTAERIESAVEYFQRLIGQARLRLKELERTGVNDEHGAVFRAFLASSCNQLAWLVSNTQGDFQEALECSQESLRIVPDEAGFLDTLGRCYYALGDLENAVKHQSRAVKLEPHSGLIVRQLELFRKALAESTKNGRDG